MEIPNRAPESALTYFMLTETTCVKLIWPEVFSCFKLPVPGVIFFLASTFHYLTSLIFFLFFSPKGFQHGLTLQRRKLGYTKIILIQTELALSQTTLDPILL